MTGMTNSIIRKPMNNEMEWLNPRLFYLSSFIRSLPTHCPDCGEELTLTPDGDEAYCVSCGLVTSASYPYVAGKRINFPYGIRL